MTMEQNGSELALDAAGDGIELADPSAGVADLLNSVNLITVTGGVRYITERTLDRMLRHTSTGHGCWVAVFALR